MKKIQCAADRRPFKHVAKGIGAVKRAVSAPVRKNSTGWESSRWEEERGLLGAAEAPCCRPDNLAELDSLSKESADSASLLKQNGSAVTDFHPPPGPDDSLSSAGASSKSSSSSLTSQINVANGASAAQLGRYSSPLLQIQTPFAEQPHQSLLLDHHKPLPSIAEVDFTPRRSIHMLSSNSMPGSPNEAAQMGSLMRASMGCSPESPFRRHAIGGMPFSDDTAMASSTSATTSPSHCANICIFSGMFLSINITCIVPHAACMYRVSESNEWSQHSTVKRSQCWLGIKHLQVLLLYFMCYKYFMPVHVCL